MSDRLAAQRARLITALGEHIPAFADPTPRSRVEAMLLVMQIEQFCGYAVRATEENIRIATDLVAARVLEFMTSRPEQSPLAAPAP